MQCKGYKSCCLVQYLILFNPNLIVSPKKVDIGITAGNKVKKGNFNFNMFDASIQSNRS